MTQIEKIENNILKRVELVKQKSLYIPISFKEFNNDIPFKTFNEFKDELTLGNVVIQKFNFGLDSFVVNNIFASKTNIFRFYFYLIMMYLSPVISIILSFIYSFWWLVGVLFFPIIFLKLMKRLYSSYLFYAASNSEIAFSFLFFLREISIKDFKTNYYWEKNK
ncbi:hypothetical protein [Flavobacterium sp.]|uniref:hypothetical protein n=1 Tax=Flavobacterium sp. TaxID=239 RepID=UPI003F6A3681